jgi:hypothetical protein
MRLASVLLVVALLLHAREATGRAPAQATGAILTVIAGVAFVQPPGALGFRPATDDQVLPVGSRVRTAATSWATLTLPDGTAATLDPASEVLLARVDPTPGAPEGLLATLQLTAGRVWGQVSSLVERGASLEVLAGGIRALAREGTFGCWLDADGTRGCWASAGSPLVVAQDDTERVLAPGEEVVIPTGGALPPPRPREVAPGGLEVRVQGAVAVRVVDPRGLTVGFAPGALVVNQLVEAATSRPTVPDRWLQVRAPHGGRYTLVVEPEATGPYLVRATLERDAAELAGHEWMAEARLGEVRVADLVVEQGVAGPTGLRATALRPADAPPPGRFAYP